MTAAGQFYLAYHEGVAAAHQLDAVNPYTPAPLGTVQQRCARMWLRGRHTRAYTPVSNR